MINQRPTSSVSIRHSARRGLGFLLVILALAPAVQAQLVPYWDGGSGSAVKWAPAPWPTDAQWIAYTRNNDSINDQRTQDPSNGGTSPQAYVNVSSGCADQALPSVYYQYDPVRQVIFYRWRVENAPNNYGTGPSPGAYQNVSAWNSGQWTVMFDINGDGYRDFAAHLNGSTGKPAAPIDLLHAIWSPTLSNTLDYENDPNVHLIASNYTAFIAGNSGSTTNQILQFDGSGNPSTIQWPNGSSETVWDYGTTRAVDVSTSSCREYYVDYQIPLGMLDASAVGGPTFTGTTPFSFMFATANSLQNPFQKDVVLNGAYVCPPTAPAPFGDPLTLDGGIIEQAIATSITSGGGSCSAVPLTAQILDSLQVTNCQTISTLVSASFMYYYDANGNGEDDDGGTWTSIPSTLTGTTVAANWDTSSLIRGQYLVALEMEDGFGHITRTWIESGEAVPGSIYTNIPVDGLGATLGTNYTKVLVGPPCGAPPPTMTKVASPADAAPGDTVTYTLTITNTSSTAVSVSQITDTLPPGFAYQSVGAGTLGAPSSSPAPGATGTISFTFPGGTTVPGSSSRTFIINATAGSTQGSFFNTATAYTNVGTINGADTTGVTVRTATLNLAKTVSSASVAQNDVVTFTLTYSNNSDVDVTNAVLTDALPAGFLYVSASPAPSSAPAVGTNGTVTWNIGNIAANTGPFSVTITATASIPGSYTNTGTLTSNEAPTVNASANVFVSGPLLAISKTASASAIIPPGNVDYTITYTNIGDATANITTVTDAVPTGFTLVTGAPTTAGCTQVGSTVTCTVNSALAAGASGTVVLRFSVATTAPNPSVNTATVNASNAASVSADYSLSILASGCGTSTIGGASRSGTAHYFDRTLTDVTTTTGEAVGHVNVTATGSGYTTAPTVTFSAPPVGGTTATGTAVVHNGALVGINMTNHGSGYTTAPTITITGTGTGATAVAVLTNSQYTTKTTAPTSATAAAIGPIEFSTTPVEIARFYSPVLSATNAMALADINDGFPVVQLYATKAGSPQVQARVRLYDFNPATLATTLIATGFSTTINGSKTNEPHAVHALTIPAGTVIAAGNRLLWTIDYVSANQSNNMTFLFDSTSSSAYARICATPIRPSITKTVDKASAVPGVDSLTYTIGYSNPGGAAIPNVVITDTLPTGLTYTNAVPAPTTISGQTLTWNIGTLAAGASGTITITAATTSGMTASSITNTATLSNSVTAPVSASATTMLRKPIVQISKSVSDTTVAPGDSFTWTINVVNAGTIGATGVVVTDTIPNYLTITGTSGAAASIVGQTVTFTVGALATGATATLTIDVQVRTSGIPAGNTELVNTASVVDNYNTTPRNATATTNLIANPVLTLVETATPSDQRVVYVDVTAGGTWTDIPTVSFVGGGCTGVTGTVSVTGSPGSYSITGVTITDPGTGCTSAPTVVFTGAGAGGATATATIGPAPGDTITYVLTVTNTGNADATGVTIFDAIPNYTSYLSGGTFSIGTVYSTPATVAPGGTAVLTYTVTVTAPLPNGVTPLTTNGGATSTNAAAPPPVTTTVYTGAAPAYEITKTPDDGLEPFPVGTLSANASATTTITPTSTRLFETGTYVVVGGTVAKVTGKTSAAVTLDMPVTAPAGSTVLQAVEYTIVYANSGDAPGTNVTVVDPLPANLVYGGVIAGYPAPSSAPAIGASGTITWTIGSLTNGGTGILKYLAWATVAGVYTNTATISDGSTLNTYNASDSATNTFGALDPYKMTTTRSIINEAPTNVAHYVITVTNPLATTANAVSVIDNLAPGFTYRPGSTVINGAAAADPSGLYVAGVALTSGGSGYTSAPTVSFTGGGGTGATAKAVISGGVVTNVVITNPGYGYTSAPAVSFTGGGGIGAAAVAAVSDASTSPQWSGLSIPGNGTLTIEFDADISANVPAGLYQNEILVYGSTPALYFDYLGTTDEDVQVCVPPPIVTAPPACGGSSGNVASILRQPGATVVWSITNGNGVITVATTGTVHQVALGSGGSGYSIAPAVSFTGGGGSGAAAIATVSGGVITAIAITNPGSGYTSAPTVVITPNGSGSGADAVAVLGTGIVYNAGASGTVDLLVTVTREFSADTTACAVSSTESVSIVGPPTITTHPTDATVCSGSLAEFSVTAVEATAYQWQISTNGGSTWSDVSGATAPTHAFHTALVDSGRLFRVVVTRGPGCQVISNAALLTVSCTPDLAVTLNSDSPDPVTAGENITYTQRVKNIGPDSATNPTFTQITPANTTFVSMTPPAGWSCVTPAAGATGSITCTADSGTLASGIESGDFTLVLATDPSLADGATVTETASVSMTESDPSPSNNSLSAVTAIQRRVDVGIEKDSDAYVEPYGDDYIYTGDPTTPTPLTYTLTVTNHGPSLATNITVTDPLPSDFTYDHVTNPATPSQGSCSYNAATRTLTCNLGSLTNNQSATITISGTVNTHSTQITNTASVTRTETDTDPSNDSASHTDNVVAPTEVKMFSLEAIETRSGVTVVWETSFEVDNVGFNVYRTVNGGALEKLNKHIITGSALMTKRRLEEGRTYRWKDTKPPAGLLQYYVEDVDLRGVHTMHGPVNPRTGSDDDVAGSPTDPDPGLGSTAGIIETPRGIGVMPAELTAPPAQRQNEQLRIASQRAGKVVVTRAGWVRVSKRELVAGGYDPGTNSRALAVFTEGVEIAIDVRDGGDNRFDDADTIEFFGTGIDTPNAGGRVYFVVNDKGRGARIRQHNGPKKGQPAPASFRYTYERKERTVFFAALVNNGDRDNFFGAIVTDWPASTPFTVENLDPSGAAAELEIVLQGATENFDHVVSIALNGRELDLIRFHGMNRHVATMSVPLSSLVSGQNTLTFTARNGWDDVSVVESVRVKYPHLYRADGGALAFTIAGGSEVSVAGFESDDVAAVDLTDPNDPLRLAVTTGAAADGSRAATLVAPPGGTRTIVVYAGSRVVAPAQVVLNQPSTWNDHKNEADLVIVTHSAFLDAAKKLASARNAQGIATTVVDVQNLYDEFAFGQRGPQAIRDFLQRSASWKRAPRYAILLGDASFDPRNYLGIAKVDFVPTKLVATGFLKTASDDWLADFDDDGVPSIAIGRIAVRTVEQANAVVAKLIKPRTASSNVTMVSDRPSGVKFADGSKYVARAVPSSVTTSYITVGATPNPPAAIVNAFNGGSMLINYIGHGSVEVWSNVFNSRNASSLRNSSLPFVVAMNCLNGYFHDLYTDSLGEALLRNPNGGAAGVWASSALTGPHTQTQMNAELYRQIFSDPSLPIGDAIIRAKQSVNDRDVRRTFIFFGDPTMRVAQ